MQSDMGRRDFMPLLAYDLADLRPISDVNLNQVKCYCDHDSHMASLSVLLCEKLPSFLSSIIGSFFHAPSVVVVLIRCHTINL